MTAAGVPAPEPAPPPVAPRRPDWVASLTLALVAALALATAWMLPWWVMRARAPQYGQRTLVVLVGPRTVEGDVRELDMLGHYVGIRPLGALARIERTLAPLGMAGAVGGLLLLPWIRRRALRVLLALPVVLLPVILLVDLQLWMEKAVNDRDPNASLNLTVTRIDPRIFGEYQVGQFRVATELGGGFYLAAVSGLLGVGLAFAAPLGRRRRDRRILATALVLALAPRAAPAAEVIARPGEIGAAVAAARDGDTVIIPAGLHRERVTVDRAVRLVGQGGAVLDGGAEGTVLRLAAPGAEVRSLTVRGGGDSYTTEDAGIRIENAPGARVVDVRVEDTLFGIFVVQSDGCVIERASVVGKDLPHERRGDGIRLWYSQRCQLRANRVERSRDVIIWYSSGTVVEDNVVRTSRYGLHYMYSNDNVFRHNRFEENQVGAAIMYSRGIELRENAFSFSDGPSAHGLLLKDADDVFIVANRFLHNATGIFFDNAPQSRDGRVDVHRNVIAGGDVGIALQPLSRRIRFWENALLGNRAQVQVLGTGTAEGNVWAVEGRGNHWSDAVLYDRDGDGVSDLPYRAESTYEVLADRHPVLAFFAATPGAEAIDTAARLFPLFAPRPKLVDPHPLVHPMPAPWTGTDATPAVGHDLALLGAALLGGVGLAARGVRRVFA